MIRIPDPPNEALTPLIHLRQVMPLPGDHDEEAEKERRLVEKLDERKGGK